MAALFEDLSVLEDDDAVGPTCRAQAVRNDDGRASREELLDLPPDRGLGGEVEGARGLVEDDDGGLAQERSGEGQALPLPTGDGGAVFAEDRVVRLGQVEDERLGLGLAGGVADRPRGRRRRQTRCCPERWCGRGSAPGA